MALLFSIKALGKMGSTSIPALVQTLGMMVAAIWHRWHQSSDAQNHLSWKRPLRPLSPTANLTLLSPPLIHVPTHLLNASRDGPG